ncbi:CLUMA_CG000374, isoform A [Clunio marinus]|uniref:CLUMA_CG000374, isoform A n=1 Tax=Clunio marinus TaxID=568069 RepID=A0A1J1HGD6_9DIPT|nr:CLUMA_CG000374, isoform A [Clunio marinus]
MRLSIAKNLHDIFVLKRQSKVCQPNSLEDFINLSQNEALIKISRELAEQCLEDEISFSPCLSIPSDVIKQLKLLLSHQALNVFAKLFLTSRVRIIVIVLVEIGR